MEQTDNRVDGCEFTASPNCDDRPPGTQIRCIVLHSTVLPTLEETVAWFRDPEKQVSAHFVVGKDGRIVQLVPIERRAWHAGESFFDGVPKVNDFSIGIEMVNLNDGNDPYPDAQVEAVTDLVALLCGRYGIPPEGIVTHAEIALPQGRKSDPRAFDMDALRSACR